MNLTMLDGFLELLEKMKLFIMLFILQLYARINIFKLMEEQYVKNTIKLARIIEKKVPSYQS